MSESIVFEHFHAEAVPIQDPYKLTKCIGTYPIHWPYTWVGFYYVASFGLFQITCFRHFSSTNHLGSAPRAQPRRSSGRRRPCFATTPEQRGGARVMTEGCWHLQLTKLEVCTLYIASWQAFFPRHFGECGPTSPLVLMCFEPYLLPNQVQQYSKNSIMMMFRSNLVVQKQMTVTRNVHT